MKETPAVLTVLNSRKKQYAGILINEEAKSKNDLRLDRFPNATFSCTRPTKTTNCQLGPRPFSTNERVEQRKAIAYRNNEIAIYYQRNNCHGEVHASHPMEKDPAVPVTSNLAELHRGSSADQWKPNSRNANGDKRRAKQKWKDTKKKQRTPDCAGSSG